MECGGVMECEWGGGLWMDVVRDLGGWGYCLCVCLSVQDSYLMNYFDDMAKYLRTGPPLYFVVKDGYHYEQPEEWNMICTMASCSPGSMGVQIAQAAQDPN